MTPRVAGGGAGDVAAGVLRVEFGGKIGFIHNELRRGPPPRGRARLRGRPITARRSFYADYGSRVQTYEWSTGKALYQLHIEPIPILGVRSGLRTSVTSECV